MVTQGTCSIGKNPPPQKRLRAEERRIQLLGIAKELFSENGFENTTAKAIAAAAGVTEAIVFRHFGSKQELYANILDRKADEIGIDDWGSELRHFAKCENDEALVLSVVKHILEADRQDPQFQRLLLQAALTGHPLRKITAQRLLPLHRFLRTYIQKRQKRGAFQKCDPELAAHAIVGIPSYYGLAKILFGMDSLTISEDRIASGFAQIILEGLHAAIGSSCKNKKAGAVMGRRSKQRDSKPRRGSE
jgi:TetR/AcrR family transcriptional regulator